MPAILIGALLLAACRHDRAQPARPPAAPSGGGTLTVPLVPDGNAYFIRAAVNGKDAGYFLIDTGSNNTGVTAGLARQMRLPLAGRGLVQGIGAIKLVNRCRIDSLQSGGADLGSHLASEVEMTTFGRSGMKVGGLLGFDTLGARAFTLDFTAQTMRFHGGGDQAIPAGSNAEELRIIDGLPAVRAEVEGHAVWLILDTGASATLMLPGSAVERWPGFLNGKDNRRTQSWGATGPVTNVSTTARSLKIFGVELVNTPVNAEWTPRVFERDSVPVGRVGMRILRHCLLTFDAPHGKIDVRWRP